MSIGTAKCSIVAVPRGHLVEADSMAAFVYTVYSIGCVHTPFTIFDNVSHERELVSCVVYV